MNSQKKATSNDRKIRKADRIRGKWTAEENQLYIEFLEENFAHFENADTRRKYQVFRAMAERIPKRDYEQCRSHHQKMERKYKTVAKIISSWTSKAPETSFADEETGEHEKESMSNEDFEMCNIPDESQELSYPIFLRIYSKEEPTFSFSFDRLLDNEEGADSNLCLFWYICCSYYCSQKVSGESADFWDWGTGQRFIAVLLLIRWEIKDQLAWAVIFMLLIEQFGYNLAR